MKPTIAQYKEKYESLLFFTKAIIHLQANKPAKKAAIKPAEIGNISEA